MAVFVGASGQAGISSPDFGGSSSGLASTYSPGQPAFWSLVILVLLVAAIVVIARGAM
jgi:hypothetical protein